MDPTSPIQHKLILHSLAIEISLRGPPACPQNTAMSFHCPQVCSNTSLRRKTRAHRLVIMPLISRLVGERKDYQHFPSFFTGATSLRKIEARGLANACSIKHATVLLFSRQGNFVFSPTLGLVPLCHTRDDSLCVMDHSKSHASELSCALLQLENLLC